MKRKRSPSPTDGNCDTPMSKRRRLSLSPSLATPSTSVTSTAHTSPPTSTQPAPSAPAVVLTPVTTLKARPSFPKRGTKLNTLTPLTTTTTSDSQKRQTTAYSLLSSRVDSYAELLDSRPHERSSSVVSVGQLLDRRRRPVCRILDARGKLIQRMGYRILEEEEEEEEEGEGWRSRSRKKKSMFVLDLEEAMYLFERSLLRIRIRVDETETGEGETEGFLGSVQEAFGLFYRIGAPSGFSASTYCVYVHLRNAGFVVHRHHNQKYRTQDPQQQQQHQQTQDPGSGTGAGTGEKFDLGTWRQRKKLNRQQRLRNTKKRKKKKAEETILRREDIVGLPGGREGGAAGSDEDDESLENDGEEESGLDGPQDQLMEEERIRRAVGSGKLMLQKFGRSESQMDVDDDDDEPRGPVLGGLVGNRLGPVSEVPETDFLKAVQIVGEDISSQLESAPLAETLTPFYDVWRPAKLRGGGNTYRSLGRPEFTVVVTNYGDRFPSVDMIGEIVRKFDPTPVYFAMVEAGYCSFVELKQIEIDVNL